MDKFYTKLLPNLCRLCACVSKRALCKACLADMPVLLKPCQICALPCSATNRICGHCLQSPPVFTQTVCPFHYCLPVDYLIKRFKKQKDFALGRVLSQQLHPCIEQSFTHNTLPDYMMPVPTSLHKMLIRGFNQTEFIAQELQKTLGIPVIHPVKQQHSHKPQKTLNRKERLKHMHSRFSLAPNTNFKIEGCNVAIIDDVMTTSATVTAISLLLKQAGVKEIDIWVLARAF